MKQPYIFDEFFASGKEESVSPFLTPDSRKWGKNLSLKSACFSALLLALAFSFSFSLPQVSSLLLVGVYFLVGTPALLGTLEDLKKWEINIDVLMTLAALLSILIGSQMEGALLLVLFELSAAIENAVTQKTKSALVSLNRLSPTRGCVVAEDGSLYEKAVTEIPVGTHLLIRAGEIVPLDGEVLQGSSSVNLVHLTGETLPVRKQKGDEVVAGARNLDGTLTIKVTRSSADSTLHRIVELITHAAEAKPKLARLIDRFGKPYATTIICLFFFFALTLPHLFSIPYLGTEGGIYRALTFLIAASPCALVIATPTAYLSALSACAKKGILLKGGVILDAIARSRSVAFDKTGTLTTGVLTCTGFESLTGSYPLAQALALAASLEKNAVHPFASAICRYAAERSAPQLPIEGFKSIPGFGLECVGPVSCAIGHPDFISTKIPPSLSAQWKEVEKHFRKEGHLSTLLLVQDSLFVFYFQDELRSGVQEMLQRLKKEHDLHLLMLTGDAQENADFIAKNLPLDGVFAGLKPEDKLQRVAEFSKREGLIMVGDGVNDAPALARATVGISLGKIGSATAVDASDAIFLQDDLSLLPWLKNKATHTLRIIKQNLTLSLGVILLATTPALLGFIPLWVAVLLHEGGTVLVGLNSLRLLKR